MIMANPDHPYKFEHPSDSAGDLFGMFFSVNFSKVVGDQPNVWG